MTDYFNIFLDSQRRCSVMYYIHENIRNKEVVRGYIRCSTDYQVEDGHTIENQRTSLEDYCEKKNFHLEAIYYDMGISGAMDIDVRLGIAQLLLDIKPRETLLVTTQDRLFRNTMMAAKLADDLERKACGFRIINLNDGIDISDDDTTNFMFKLMAAIAENERLLISRRVISNIAYRKMTNQYKKNPAFGERSLGKKIPLVENPKEMEVVKFIKNLIEFNGEFSYIGIAKEVEKKFPASRFNIREWTGEKIKSIIVHHNLKKDT